MGCRLPVVQTGMGWVSGANLTAATSAAGGFGILAAVTMTPDQLRDAVRGVKERTDAAFGVNFRADQPDLAERVAFVVAEGVRLVSFAGAPTKDAVARCHDAGVVVMPTVGARRHAEKVLEMGVDAVIAQGGEGGGHTGTVPTSLLLPQVVDAVGAEIPVLGAGGFHDGRGLVAALAYGADGIAMGTRFLLDPGEPRAGRGEGSLHRGLGVRHRGDDGAGWRARTRDPHRGRRSHRAIAQAAALPPSRARRPALPQGDRHTARRPRCARPSR